jgi:hypothetical protein
MIDKLGHSTGLTDFASPRPFQLGFCKEVGDEVKIGKIGPFLPSNARAQLDCGASDHARNH